MGRTNGHVAASWDGEAREGGVMTVKEIVGEWLKTHGYDGLCTTNCGCGMDDLIPCCYGHCEHCVPAKKVIATAEHCQGDCEYELGDEIFVPATAEPEKEVRG